MIRDKRTRSTFRGPNATRQARREAGARRTLYAVACTRLLGPHARCAAVQRKGTAQLYRIASAPAFGSSFLRGRSTTNGARNVCNPSSRHRTSFLGTAPLLGSRAVVLRNGFHGGNSLSDQRVVDGTVEHTMRHRDSNCGPSHVALSALKTVAVYRSNSNS